MTVTVPAFAEDAAPRMAKFPLGVESVTVDLPPRSLKMPPPRPPVVEAELPLRMESVTVTVPRKL